jgi:hypothetical protein
MVRFPALLVVVFASLSFARDVRVTTEAELRAAVGAAQPGDIITLADGTYALNGKLSCTATGTASQPIVVRGETVWGATLESNTVIAIGVSAPFWRFEDFAMRGVCASDSNCEHAFQVTGKATDVVLRGLRLVDFNAQLKVNATPAGDGGYDMPHRGLVEHCEIYDSRPRNTGNPVTKLNIDTGDDFVVRDNVIRDFAKNGGDFVSYGSFMKSGGKRGLYERNLVLCKSGGQAMTDTRIGLSFGGGGTGAQFCAPAFNASVPCSVEHEDGVMRNNLIANCSDVGVYLNRAKNTSVLHNTMVGTNGVDFRFSTTSGRAIGNLISSNVRTRDTATMTAMQNVTGVTVAQFNLAYANPLAGDFGVVGPVSAWVGQVTPPAGVTDDYCARVRTPTAWTVGAYEHALGACDAGVVVDGGTGGGGGTPTGGGGGAMTGGGGGAMTGGGGGAMTGGGGGAMTGGGGGAMTGGGGGEVATGGGGGGEAVVDAGEPADGGAEPLDPVTSGCGCSSAEGAAVAVLLVVLRRRARS